MNAIDVMTRNVVSVKLDPEIERIARELRQHGDFDIRNYKMKQLNIRKLFDGAEP